MAGPIKLLSVGAFTLDTILRLENLVVEFPTRGGGKVHAVTDVSLDIKRGETLGLVGESGCG